ncbi:mechanosensitive ion channel family protein [Sphingomonas xanthus]|uniref:Mechanosensitive ion channel family protein n=1 Tax=Sphingomonas xanthus TaxID=2594473 RepID=A0A516ITK0_9SPHN|nr:mechanosensitive ion channel family protein [Sphingomonas xanthus]QDP20226.1 mechanosensitive ion channel family protein [Sphingomonas xanthus]
MTSTLLNDAVGQTGKVAERGSAPVKTIATWVADNMDGLAIGALVALGIVAVMLLIRLAGSKMLAGDPECRRWRGIIGSVLAKTSMFFMVAAAISIVVSYAEVHAKLARLAEILFIVAAAIQAAIWAREIVLGVIRSRIGDDPGASTLGNAMGIVRVLVSVAAFAIAAIVILDNLGVNVTALVAGLGVGGIAIGLAAQGIFSDLFAGLSIVFDRPFRRGQTIRYGGASGSVGTVERIGMKTTRIRSVSGEQLVIANTKLLEQEVTNVNESRVRRIWLPFGVIYQTGPEVIENLPNLLEQVIGPMKTVKIVRCCATAFGASSIDIELVYDDRSTDADTLAKHKSLIITGIMKLFAREGIEFAYPTQTTFTAAPDGTMIMPYPSVQPVTSVEPPREEPPLT